MSFSKYKKQKLIDELITAALWDGCSFNALAGTVEGVRFAWFHRDKAGKPGYIINRLSKEERDILKEMTSDDWNRRIK